MDGLTIADGFREALRASGLDRFEEVMALEAPPAAVTRAVPGRFTARIQVAGQADGPPLVLYLKRYRGRLRAPAARNEWRMLHELAAAGIPCPRPVAVGERPGVLGPTASFLLTADLTGAVQADWWIAGRPERRRELIRAVAGLAARFHRAGFHHQDFYLCHFFVREEDGSARREPLDLSLIDLQRCGRHGGRRRWLVKDLAQLHHSLGQAGFSGEHWEEFLSRYGGVDTALGRAILRKSARIARHRPRHG